MLLIMLDKTPAIHFLLAWSRFSASHAPECWYAPVRRPIYVNRAVVIILSPRSCYIFGQFKVMWFTG